MKKKKKKKHGDVYTLIRYKCFRIDQSSKFVSERNFAKRTGLGTKRRWPGVIKRQVKKTGEVEFWHLVSEHFK